LGEMEVTLWYQGRPFKTRVLISEHVSEALLGINWLTENGVLWNFVGGTVVANGITIPLIHKVRNGVCSRVMLMEDIQVPARSELDLNTKVVYKEIPRGKGGMASVPCTTREGLVVASVIVPSRCNNVPMHVINPTSVEISLKANSLITELEPIAFLNEDVTPVKEVAEFKHVYPLLDEIDKDVSESEKSQLKNILETFSDVFSVDAFDLGRSSVVTHTIDTGTAPPVRQQLRRHPMAHLPLIDAQIEEMQKQRIIEPSQSPWGANVVIVTKKDGTPRFCIDYRGLNTVTCKDAYPLPRIETCLDALAGAKYFSAFDLRSGFHQILLEPASRDRTSFVTRGGTYRFVTMPFGLCNAPATCQRLMDLVMTGINFQKVLVYMDDIVLFSSTVEEHLSRLVELLTRLRGANLKLKPSKCQLLRREIAFLGHIVSQEGLSVDPAKIESVTQWPVPESVTEVRGFIGLCSYYRKFILGFAEIARPLHALTGKGVPFIWSRECQGAFDTLKKCLTSTPILTMPTDSDGYILDTDASNRSIGAVLSQVQDGQERVIAYASKLLSGPERNYCVTRKELLAIVYYVKHFRPYLLGRSFKVRTDHAALQWLRKTPEPIGQQARWLEILEEFNFSVEHRPGLRHGNADALSRIPCKQCAVTYEEVEIEPETSVRANQIRVGVAPDGNYDPWLPSNLKSLYEEDVELKRFYALFTELGTGIPWDRVVGSDRWTKAYWTVRDSLVLREGVLYRRWLSADGTHSRLQVIPPTSLRKDLIKTAHSGLTGGHLGVTRTMAQVELRAYWVGWHGDVNRYCKTCPQCARYFRGKPPRQGYLQHAPIGEPFERIAIDLTGPHPRSRSGSVYILTVLDIFSKWVEAIPIRNKECATVAKALVDVVFARYGIPLQILSDNGGEFEGNLMLELCRLLDIDKLRTTYYKPSTNGAVERFHRTMNSMLAKVVNENQRDWDERLPSVMAAYRASKHESTGFSPNFLILGREARAPLDIVMGIPEQDRGLATYNKVAEDRLQVMRDSYDLVREHTGRCAERSKKYYDLRVRPAVFEKGKWVWVYSPRKFVGRSPKWQSMYTGPWLITEVRGAVNVVVQRTLRSKPQVVHIDKLKLVLGDTPPSWLPVVPDPSVVAADIVTPDSVTEDDVVNNKSKMQVSKPLHDQNRDDEGVHLEVLTKEVEVRTKRKTALPKHLDNYVMFVRSYMRDPVSAVKEYNSSCSSFVTGSKYNEDHGRGILIR
jgi:transposase InsO family protein